MARDEVGGESRGQQMQAHLGLGKEFVFYSKCNGIHWMWDWVKWKPRNKQKQTNPHKPEVRHAAQCCLSGWLLCKTIFCP